MKQLQFQFKSYAFKPTLLGILITMVCIPLFIKFGLWQYNKATVKQDIQAKYMNALNDAGMAFPSNISPDDTLNIDALKYQKVKALGQYLPQYTVLLDNQTLNNRVGYHVVTPFKLEQSQTLVLINRGWIPANAVHSQLPVVVTPEKQHALSGQIWVPSTRYFTLEKKADQASLVQLNQESAESDKPYQMQVMQNLDLVQYTAMTKLAVSPLVVKLDASVVDGGFERYWQVPAARITTHIGYAFQWFGFAFATLIIFLYMSIKKRTHLV